MAISTDPTADLFPGEAPERRSLVPGVIILTVCLAVIALIVWAAIAELDQVTRGDGRVVPSKRVQVAQNLEGGIVSEILVKAGDHVEPGDLLIRLDATQFGAEYDQRRTDFLAGRARLARLAAEARFEAPVFAADLLPEVVEVERSIHGARAAELTSTLAMLDAQTRQRREALNEARAALDNAGRRQALAAEELGVLEPLVARGLAPRLDRIRARQRLAEAEGAIEGGRLAVARAEAAIDEVEQQRKTAQERFRTRAIEELATAKLDHDRMVDQLPALVDKVRRTEVRSPVKGIINRVLVTTEGGVATPGQPLAEIVPVEDALLIEAEVKPADIAFLHPGQMARVKLTAYDYSVYGMLDATVETIGADAISKEDGSSSYVVRVRTTDGTLTAPDGRPLDILPGMVAQVDILTGRRTVLDYLLKPVVKLREMALTER
ncbi:HlyD family type I secretion periplasmic adaptor subunit [Tistrella bauzanensis]|uniref:Membrane fusion protein (MFP) family protein n=1 Tax=Tistrella arctica TaxID=3133430 RepID=A0ABU9YIC8_9PROT